jgi:hypothetical protein
MGVNGNPGSGVTAVIAGAPGAYTSCGAQINRLQTKAPRGAGLSRSG